MQQRRPCQHTHTLSTCRSAFTRTTLYTCRSPRAVRVPTASRVSRGPTDWLLLYCLSSLPAVPDRKVSALLPIVSPSLELGPAMLKDDSRLGTLFFPLASSYSVRIVHDTPTYLHGVSFEKEDAGQGTFKSSGRGGVSCRQSRYTAVWRAGLEAGV